MDLGWGIWGVRVWEGARCEGERERENERERGRVNRWGREGEGQENDVAPKIAETGLTGQTGCSYRSDRSGPDCQEHFGLVICRVGFETNGRD